MRTRNLSGLFAVVFAGAMVSTVSAASTTRNVDSLERSVADTAAEQGSALICAEAPRIPLPGLAELLNPQPAAASDCPPDTCNVPFDCHYPGNICPPRGVWWCVGGTGPGGDCEGTCECRFD
jgi:hypothetical protein